MTEHDQMPLSPEQISAFNRLRRLLEHSQTDVPGIIAKKAMNAFALQPAAEGVEAAVGEVHVVVYPQDPFVGEAEVRSMHADDIRPGLVNTRVRIRDSAGKPAKPDAEGNYLYQPGSIEFDQINSFYYTTFTLRMHEGYARRPLPWAFPTPRIAVDPHVGDEGNAFYSEQDRLLGFHSFRVDGEVINGAQSADVVSHEAGHALLDGIRDLYNESFGLGPAAFHESFGDMTAVLVALHDDSLIARLLEWTKGDLRMDNFVSAVAEQMTQRLTQARAEHVQGHTVYLRNALNKLNSVPFDALPYLPERPEVELGRESHNYSRLFTGTFYEILAGIYEHWKPRMDERLALHRARDLVGYLLLCSVELGPVGEFDFSDMARAWLAADIALYGGEHSHILRQAFEGRGILSAGAAEEFLASLQWLPDVRLPEDVTSPLAAGLFLEEKLLPALKLPDDSELMPMSAHRNGQGHAFLTYFAHRLMTLEGTQYQQFDGATIDVFGGLSLMFDSERRLRSAFYRPVTDEDVRQIQLLIADLIRHGLIAESQVEGKVAKAAPMYMIPDSPKGLWLAELAAPAVTPPGSARLIKFPVLFDQAPETLSDLLTYLESWRDFEAGALGDSGAPL